MEFRAGPHDEFQFFAQNSLKLKTTKQRGKNIKAFSHVSYYNLILFYQLVLGN